MTISFLQSVISEKEKYINEQNNLVGQKEKTIKQQEENIKSLKKTINEKDLKIAELSSESQKVKKINYPTEINEILRRDFKTLLKTIQMFDITTQDFGSECHEYVRGEIERAMKKCKMRFEDYHEGTEKYYIIENVDNRDSIFYDTRAIVDIVDNQVVLEGHVYVPRAERQ